MEEYKPPQAPVEKPPVVQNAQKIESEENVENSIKVEKSAVVAFSPEEIAEKEKKQQIKKDQEAQKIDNLRADILEGFDNNNQDMEPKNETQKPIEYITFDRKEIANLSVEKITGNLSKVLQKMELEYILKKTSPNALVKMESSLSLVYEGDISFHAADPDNRIRAGYSVIGESAKKIIKVEIECLQSEILSKFEGALNEKLKDLKLDPEKGYTVFDWENNVFLDDVKKVEENVTENAPIHNYSSLTNFVSEGKPAEHRKY